MPIPARFSNAPNTAAPLLTSGMARDERERGRYPWSLALATGIARGEVRSVGELEMIRLKALRTNGGHEPACLGDEVRKVAGTMCNQEWRQWWLKLEAGTCA